MCALRRLLHDVLLWRKHHDGLRSRARQYVLLLLYGEGDGGLAVGHCLLHRLHQLLLWQDVKHGWPHSVGLQKDVLAHHRDAGVVDKGCGQGRGGDVLYGCCHWPRHLVHGCGVLGGLVGHLRSSLLVHPLLRDVLLLIGIHWSQQCCKITKM